MKKVLLALAVFMMLSVSQAFALDYTYSAAYTSHYGDTTQETVFAYDEKPWVFLQLTPGSYSSTFGESNTDSTWITPSGASFSVVWTDDKNGFWYSVDDDHWFGNSALGITGQRQVGDWTINPVWSSVETTSTIFGKTTTVEDHYNTDPLHFKVVAAPEPISAGLFLLGGAGLAIVRRRRS